MTDLPNNHDDGNQSGGDDFDTTVIDILDGRIRLEQLRLKTGGDAPPPTQAKKREPRRGAKFTALADVRPQPVRWLWPDRIACKLVLFTGLPDCGKTTAAIDIAARVTMGEVWPDAPAWRCMGACSSSPPRTGSPTRSAPGRTRRAPTCGAFMCSPACTTSAAIQTPSSCSRTSCCWRRRCRRSATSRWSSSIPSRLTWAPARSTPTRPADVRAVLSPLRDFADQHGVAVIGLTHPSKSVNKAMNAATGGLVRIVGGPITALPTGFWRPLPKAST